MHKLVVNPQIPQKFKTDQDRITGTFSEEYDAWIVQDQAIFIWLLSTIFEAVLPRVLACKHAYEVWDKIHQYFNAQMKARVRQFRVELKSTKKGNKTVTEFVLRIKAIDNYLLSVGDFITEQDQIDSILNGLPEKYSPFVMQMYGCPIPPSLCDVEALLYVQEAQLEKYCQELSLANATTNVAQSEANFSSKSTRGGSQYQQGRSNSRSRGRGRARSSASSGNKPTC
jgi:histone deacetylase 1/2